MSQVSVIRRLTFPILTALQIDALFRYLNRSRILILAYHGLTDKTSGPRPWTLTPVDSFERQIRHVKKHYHVISLEEAVTAMRSGGPLPDNPAVITFDDGYRNNLTLAFPLLKKYEVRATIFLTAGYVGTSRILPMDEAYLVIAHAQTKGTVVIPEMNLGPLSFEAEEAVDESYRQTLCILKKVPTKTQKIYLDVLKRVLRSSYDGDEIIKDFSLLSWDEVCNLLGSGLIQIGAHTVSHEILSNVSLEESTREIVDSKRLIEENTGCDVTLFAYPNGTVADYNEDHICCLREKGFICAVTTTGRLNEVSEELFELKRICVGPEFTELPGHFALKTSGLSAAVRKGVGHFYD